MLMCFIWLVPSSKSIPIFPISSVRPEVSVGSVHTRGSACHVQCACVHICIPRLQCMRVFVHKRAHICCVWASLKEPQWQYSWGRSKLLVGRAVTIKGGRSVKTSPVLPGWAKVLLKRFFWGTLNVVKWSPPQLGHSKRPSLTSRAKQTPSPLAQPCQFPSNPFGLDPVSRYPPT